MDMDITLSDLSDSDWLPGGIEGTAVSTRYLLAVCFKSKIVVSCFDFLRKHVNIRDVQKNLKVGGNNFLQ